MLPYLRCFPKKNKTTTIKSLLIHFGLLMLSINIVLSAKVTQLVFTVGGAKCYNMNIGDPYK